MWTSQACAKVLPRMFILHICCGSSISWSSWVILKYTLMGKAAGVLSYTGREMITLPPSSVDKWWKESFSFFEPSLACFLVPWWSYRKSLYVEIVWSGNMHWCVYFYAQNIWAVSWKRSFPARLHFSVTLVSTSVPFRYTAWLFPHQPLTHNHLTRRILWLNGKRHSRTGVWMLGLLIASAKSLQCTTCF